MISPDERIVALLQEARLQLEAERSRRNEPIAIVGIGCRFPGGASSPAEFWRLLRKSFDATGDVPADRWVADAFYDPDPEAPGKAYTKRGSFLGSVDGFDAEFFGISPREAIGMDPQQRLLLEVVWEALEDAGIAPATLRGSATGVWVGLCVDDYARRTFLTGDATDIDAYNTLGNTRSIAAGRISYVLDLHGPTVQLDTACSSSLVAIHQACQSLRLRECDLGLVGGVNLMLAPESTIALCKLRALAPDGRCKTFDASADGYGRGEGCGLVVLKRLADAQAAGDRIYAVVRGSACNHDGHSNGLTAPSGIAQEAVIRAALANGGIDGANVGYVEAHGTGTLLGDPIEVLALHRVYGQGRSPGTPLYLGAVKTNFGHLEGAAGVAGVIKAALCLRHGEIPRQPQLSRPNPKIPWADLAVQVVRESVDWPRSGVARFAGVSSFGISGTNAHVVLEEPPALERRVPTPGRAAELVLLSARTGEALEAVAGRLREHVEAHPDVALGDLAYSLTHTRSLHEQRLALSVPHREALLEALRLAAGGETASGATRSSAGMQRGGLAWLFTGQGAQQLGMGRALYSEWPAFRAAFDAACAALDGFLERPLREIMWMDPSSPAAFLLDQTGYTQPALFALEWALAQLWRSWGVEPDILLGHSIGEISAACVAGVFSLEDAARLVGARARLMQALPSGGAMLSIAAEEGDVAAALVAYQRTVSVAALNAPRSTVIAGVEADVEKLAAAFAARGVSTKRLSVSHAFHSPLMEPMLEAFQRVARSLHYRAPRLPIVSNLSGQLAGEELTRPEYWVRQVRQAVRFAQGARTLRAAGVTHFVEMGPRATLLGLVSATLGEDKLGLFSSLRSGRTEPVAVLEALAGWIATGGAFDAKGVFPPSARRVALPVYPWQRQRYWSEPQLARRVVEKRAAHPLLGARVATPSADAAYEVVLSAADPSWLSDHRVGGSVVVPAAAIAELIRAAGIDSGSGSARQLMALAFQTPLLIPGQDAVRVQVLLTEGSTKASVYSQLLQAPAGSRWSLHSTAELSEAGDVAPTPLDLRELRRRCTEQRDASEVYEALAARGLEYGPAFRGLRALWIGSEEVLAEVTLADALDAEPYGLHPALLDAALHAVVGLIASQSQALLPFELGRSVVYQPGARRAVVHARLVREATLAGVVADVTLADDAGRIIAQLDALRLRPVEVTELQRLGAAGTPEAFYQLNWQSSPAPAFSSVSGRWLIVAEGADSVAQAVAQGLRARGAQCRQVSVSELSAAEAVEHVVCFWNPEAAPQAALSVASQALLVAQTLMGRQPAPKLCWVTRRAVAVGSMDDVSPSAASLWGLGRTLSAEQPELGCRLVDVELEPGTLPEGALLDELAAGDDENQVAWRGGQRHVARMAHAASVSELPTSDDYQLQIQHKGDLESLSIAAATRTAPGVGQVEIRVHASGLNFRDVLNALGMYPGKSEPLGGEFAGVVTALGPGVSDVALGDRVMGLARGAFRRFVTVDTRLITQVPDGLSFEEAASIPVVFATAWYALRDLAAVEPGERLLVHAAAGGVGMAAVQLARWFGLELLATASPAKWGVVRELGIEHVASSRDLRFAEAFRSAVGGADVVLNALTGEFIDASLSLLSPGGRFIELGKAEIRDPARVAAAHPGVRYRAFDLAELIPERIAEILTSIRDGFRAGRLKPLPLRSFKVTEAEAAFRFMARAQHVGKIVLVPPANSAPADATVLISGGLGALGLQLARHFAQGGVRHLLLTGRRGLDTPGASAAVALLEASGTRVTVAAIDMTNRDALAAAIANLPPGYPLRGVVHAAGILDDGLLSEQTAARLAQVMAPKVLGAWHLHELTRAIPLDFFVLFSSLAGTLGSAAQGGYAAANAFLDGLAVHRQALGLPASSLAWGPWAESGMAASLDAQLRARFSRQGISMLSTAQGLSLLDSALRRPEPQLVIVPLDLRVVARALGGAVPPLWRTLVRPLAPRIEEGASVLQELAALSESERSERLLDVVRTELARVLSLEGAKAVPIDRDLGELGLDSLMAIEFRNVLARRLGVSLSATFAFDQPTPAAIARYLLERVDIDRLAVGHSVAINPSVPSGEEVGRGPARVIVPPSEDQQPEPEQRADDASPGEKIDRAAQRGTYPATDAQERLWFSYRVSRDNPVYNQGLQVRILGSLKRDALQASVAYVTSRHEAIHTRFKTDSNGRLLQWVDPASEVAIQLCDLSESAEPEAALFAWIRREERLPFDLEKGPVARCTLLRMGPSSHVLAFTFHHILIDGWSLGVLITEIMKAYLEFVAGRPPKEPAISLHMGDYACWERDLVGQGRHRAELERYQSLSQSPALELPTCVDSGSAQEEEGSILYFDLTRELRGRLRALAAQSRVTLSTLLNAAFACLLSRYTGQKRFGLGVVMANRSRPEQEGIVGFLANTMLVDCNLEDDSGLAGLLARIHAEVERALANSWLPMSALLRSPDSSATEVGQSALLAAVFSYQGIFRDTSWALGETTWELLNRSNVNGHVPGTSKFDLWLSMYPWHEDTLGGSLEFRTARFGQAYAERFVQHFKALLDSMTRGSRGIADLEVLVREDYEALQRWNDTEAAYAKHSLVHELFEAQAIKRPTAIAVATETEQASYAQLNDRANAIAEHLRSVGVAPGMNVAICVDRSLDMVSGLLGILKAGGTYVPLDPAFPPLRVSFMLEDSRAPVVVSQSQIDGSAWPKGISRIDLDTLPERSARRPGDHARTQGPTGDELMYVIYTSGSTGQPKGVRVRHRGVINLLGAFAKDLDCGQEDTLLAVTTLSFDIAALEIFLPLVTGGRVELASASEARDVDRLQRRIQQRRVTVMQATPSTWQMFRAADVPRNETLRVLCGGEALPTDLASWLVAHFPAVWNVYGPTETTIWSTSCRLPAGPATSVRIGAPLANTQVHVLDEGGRRVPIGVPGELNISGDGVAAGYFERPELTADKFVTRSWLGQSCAMYRTGDLVRQRLDGELEFLGRLDHQVKIRGFRIELGEVEAALLRHPNLGQCVCVVRTDSGESNLVAYLVARMGAEPLSDAELLRHLGSTLPGYMLPAAFVWLDRFPLTPNGKVDRRSLPGPSTGVRAAAADYVSPTTDTERALAQLWEELLGLERVGSNDDFFRLGGDSLKSVRLQARAAKHGLEFTIRDVFEARTLGALALRIEQHRSSPHPLLTVALNPDQARAALWSDVRLAESVRVRSGSRAAGNAVLLTGATGFLGTHLLRELAREVDPIYVLVREQSDAKARVRLAQSFEQYGLPLACLERVQCLAGDLKRPGLGLSRDAWSSVSRSLKHIYHSAAAVNHVEGYAALKSANVDGLEQLLSMAAEGGSALHFISTLDVIEPSEYAAGALIREDAEVPAPIHGNGYAQSKWVAEQVIALASQRGIHCTIIRLPILGGHSESGAIASQRYWYTQALRAMWLMKSVPVWPEPLQVVPVDYAAKVIVGLSKSKAPSGSAFHLTHPAGVSVEDVHQAFAELGRASHRVTMEEWIAQVGVRAEGSSDEELEYLSGFLLGANVAARAAEAATKHLSFDRSNVERALGSLLPVLPPAAEMVRRALTFLQRTAQLDGQS